MKTINTISALKGFIHPLKESGSKIAFVPTMGALHNGHLSLIALAKQEADIVVCSIFVNPTQFTDPKDLEKYPRPLEHDKALLDAAGCDAVFMPSVLEMYPSWPVPENWHIDLGPAEFVLEGAFRKGHYQGVTQIVKKLFDAVEPDVAFFGQKDFQQVLMIKNMVEVFNMPVEIVSCPIIRETDGLAMSSRNIHLSAADRRHALVLSHALQYINDHAGRMPREELMQHAEGMISNTPGVILDYLTIADPATLTPENSPNPQGCVALVAAKVGDTRLIDNVIIGSGLTANSQ